MPPPHASWPLTLKVVSESSVTWATSVPILVFLALSVLDLGPMYATDSSQTVRRQRDRRQTSDVHHSLMPRLGAGHNKKLTKIVNTVKYALRLNYWPGPAVALALAWPWGWADRPWPLGLEGSGFVFCCFIANIKTFLKFKKCRCAFKSVNC